MKVFKRNAVIITVLLFVAVAVYLNWSYNRGQDLTVENPVDTGEVLQSDEDADEDAVADTEDDAEAADEDQTAEDAEDTEDAEDDDATGLYYGGDSDTTISTTAADYFDSARLSRDQARDSATALLQEAAAIETASQEEIDNALNAITAMATYSIQEAQLENLLMAKDFAECVVFISDEGVSVIVPSSEEGLSESAVARITETVTSELGVGAEVIKIIPVS